MEKPCTVDTVDGNSHTVVSAMENACKDVSYSNNPHITRPGLDSGSEAHTGHGLTSWVEAHTGHDLILGGEQDRTFYIIKKMMEKFLDDLRSSKMRSSTKTSNSVDLRQCKKISRDLGELNQDQVINKMEFHLKIQSPVNQRGAIDGFCERAKYGHFGPDKDGVFGPGKDFYMPGKRIFRAWCGPAFYAAEWFGLVWVSTPENQTGVGLVPCRGGVVSVRFGSGFYRFEPERIIYRMYIYIDCFYI
jgi:hypothetical protein